MSELLAQGHSARRDGRHADAIRIFAAAAGQAPDAPEPAFGQCLAALEAAAPEAARFVPDLLRRFPRYAPGWEDLGRWLLKAGKPEAALACLQRAAAVSPSADLLLACGTALRTIGRLTEARGAYDAACQLAPNLARAAFLSGLGAQDDHDLAAARAAYEHALRCDAGLVEARVNLGIVLQAMGDLAAAKRAYGGALRRRDDAFGRISQALTGAPSGELWLDLDALRRHLTGLPQP